MANIKQIQADFTAGVLDPEVAGRVDVDLYYKGVQRGDNVVPLAQGGLTRRPGTRNINQLPKRMQLLGGLTSLISRNFADTAVWADIGTGDVTRLAGLGNSPEQTTEQGFLTSWAANGVDTGMHARTNILPPGKYTYTILFEKRITTFPVTMRLRMGNQLCFFNPSITNDCYPIADVSITANTADETQWHRLIATVDKPDFSPIDIWLTSDGVNVVTMNLYGGLLYKGELAPDLLVPDAVATGNGGTLANLLDNNFSTLFTTTTSLGTTDDYEVCRINMGRSVDVTMVDIFDIQLVNGTNPAAPIESIGEFALEGTNDPAGTWTQIGDGIDIVTSDQPRRYRRGVENVIPKTLISPSRQLQYIRLVRRNPQGLGLFNLVDWEVQISQIRIMTAELYAAGDVQGFIENKNDSLFISTTYAQENISVTANATTDQSGAMVADQIIEAGGLGQHRMNVANTSLVAGTRYRQELVARAPAGATGRQFLLLEFGTANFTRGVFDLDNGTVVGNLGNVAGFTVTITPIVNSSPTLYRCQIESDITTTETTTLRFAMAASSFGGAYTSVGGVHQFWCNAYSGLVPPKQPLSNSKMIEFAFNTEQTYGLVLTDQNLTVVVSRDSDSGEATEISNHALFFTNDDIQTVDFVQSADTLLLFHRDAGILRISRLGDSDWFMESFIITVPLEDLNDGEGPTVIFSDVRGWPQTATFYQQRLWVGGSRSLPNRLLGSQLADLFDFATGTGDIGPIDVTIDSDQINQILHLRASRRLEIFTSGQEFTSNAGLVSPSTIAITPQSAIGIKKGLKPLDVDGATLFMGRDLEDSVRESSTLWQFLFDFAEDAHRPSDVALLSSSLLTNPIDMDAQAAKQSYIYIVNEDGTMAVFLTSRQQNVAAWSRWTFAGGKCRTTAVLADGNHYGVIDYVNSETDRDEQFSQLVLFDTTQLLDAQQNFPIALGPSTTLTATNPLQTPAGETDIPLKLIVDGSPLAGTFVSEPVGGVIPLGATVDVTVGYSVGRQINVTVTTMPTSFALPKGVSFGEYLRLVKCMLRLLDTQGIQINGRDIPLFDASNVGYDASTGLLTGFFEEFLEGWARDAQITISQIEPYPFTLLAANIEYEV